MFDPAACCGERIAARAVLDQSFTVGMMFAFAFAQAQHAHAAIKKIAGHGGAPSQWDRWFPQVLNTTKATMQR